MTQQLSRTPQEWAAMAPVAGLGNLARLLEEAIADIVTLAAIYDRRVEELTERLRTAAALLEHRLDQIDTLLKHAAPHMGGGS